MQLILTISYTRTNIYTYGPSAANHLVIGDLLRGSLLTPWGISQTRPYEDMSGSMSGGAIRASMSVKVFKDVFHPWPSNFAPIGRHPGTRVSEPLQHRDHQKDAAVPRLDTVKLFHRAERRQNGHLHQDTRVRDALHLR